MRVLILDFSWLESGGIVTFRDALSDGLEALGVESEHAYFTTSGRAGMHAFTNSRTHVLKQPGWTVGEMDAAIAKKPSNTQQISSNLEYMNGFDLIVLNCQGHYGWDKKVKEKGAEERPYWLWYLEHTTAKMMTMVHGSMDHTTRNNYPFELEYQKLTNWVGNVFVGEELIKGYTDWYGESYTKKNEVLMFLPLQPKWIVPEFIDKEPIVGMTGRFTAGKGNWMLIEALSFIDPSITVQMYGRKTSFAAGDGDEDIPEHIKKGEWQYPQDLERVYDPMRVHLSLTRYDGNGDHYEYVTLEAMARGCVPIVPVSMNQKSPVPQIEFECRVRKANFDRKDLGDLVSNTASLPDYIRQHVVEENFAYLREYHDPTKYAKDFLDTVGRLSV